MPYDRGSLAGLKEAKAAFKALDPVLQDELATAAFNTALRIKSQAVLRVRRRFGILASKIQASVNRKTGIAKVGVTGGDVFVNGKRENASYYAHLVEFGHGGPRPAPAYPFMIPAMEGEQADFLRECQQAGQRAEVIVAATGGGLL